jgi:hypothetical protein
MNVTFQGTTYRVANEPELLALIVTLRSDSTQVVDEDRFIALRPVDRHFHLHRIRRRRSQLKKQ